LPAGAGTQRKENEMKDHLEKYAEDLKRVVPTFPVERLEPILRRVYLMNRKRINRLTFDDIVDLCQDFVSRKEIILQDVRLSSVEVSGPQMRRWRSGENKRVMITFDVAIYEEDVDFLSDVVESGSNRLLLNIRRATEKPQMNPPEAGKRG
jgi:hypothetical protein